MLRELHRVFRLRQVFRAWKEVKSNMDEFVLSDSTEEAKKVTRERKTSNGSRRKEKARDAPAHANPIDNVRLLRRGRIRIQYYLVRLGGQPFSKMGELAFSRTHLGFTRICCEQCSSSVVLWTSPRRKRKRVMQCHVDLELLRMPAAGMFQKILATGSHKPGLGTEVSPEIPRKIT